MPVSAFLTLPNVISLSRLVLAVFFVIVDHPFSRVALVATAALTDFLDGFVARIGNKQSKSGALIDPIADRVFVLAAVSTYLIEGVFSTGQYFIFISRDLATAFGFLVARTVPSLKDVDFKARLLGKGVTVLQLATLVTVLIFPKATDGLIVGIGLLSAVAIVDYTIALWHSRTRL